jgi:hypothetical protein
MFAASGKTLSEMETLHPRGSRLFPDSLPAITERTTELAKVAFVDLSALMKNPGNASRRSPLQAQRMGELPGIKLTCPLNQFREHRLSRPYAPRAIVTERELTADERQTVFRMSS